MKNLLLSVFLLLSLAGIAQPSQPAAMRVYWDKGQLVITDASGNRQQVFSGPVQVAKYGNRIQVSVNGSALYFEPTKFLNQSGTAYSSTVDGALTAYQAGLPTGPVSVTGMSQLTNDAGYLKSKTGYDLSQRNYSPDDSLLNRTNALSLKTKTEFVSKVASLSTLSGLMAGDAFEVTEPGLGGRFVFRPASANLTVDGGIVIAVPGGYMERQYDYWANVKWWGAKGDGITDDAAAINRATAALKYGSTLFFPGGTYLAGSTIFEYRGLKFLGAGTFDGKGTTLKLKTGANCVLLKAGRAIQNVGTDDASFMALENLKFDGNALGQTVENDGVQFWGQYVGSYIRNVFFVNFFGHALDCYLGMDLLLDHVWGLGNQSSDGYGFVFNGRATDGYDGYLNLNHVYVEIQMKSSTPIDVYSAPASMRGTGIYVNRVISFKATELHFEYNSNGVLFRDCYAADIGNIGFYAVGNGIDSRPGVVQLYDELGVRSLTIHKGEATGPNLGPVRWVSIANGLSNDILEGDLLSDSPVLSGYISSNTGASPHPSLYQLPRTKITNQLQIAKAGSASPTVLDFLAGDGSYSHGFHAHDFDFRIGSARYQPSNAFKPFLTINSFGNNADNLTLGAPLYLFNRSFLNNLSAGAILNYNNVPTYYDGSGARSFATIAQGSAAPTTAPGWPGQIYVDTQNSTPYMAVDAANWLNLRAYNNLTGRPTLVSQFTNDAGFLTNAISGTTTNGTNLVNVTQSGTGRAMFVSRGTDNAARPLFSLVQNTTANGQPNLVIQQQDPTQKALVINNDGSSTNNLFSVDGQGNMTAVTGAIGSSLTVSGKSVVGFVTANATYNPGSMATGTQQSTTLAVAGTTMGQFVRVSFSNALQGVRVWGEVSAAGTVTVHFRNDTGSSVTLASGTLTARVD